MNTAKANAGGESTIPPTRLRKNPEPPPAKDSFKCKFCPKTFISERAILSHKKFCAGRERWDEADRKDVLPKKVFGAGNATTSKTQPSERVRGGKDQSHHRKLQEGLDPSVGCDSEETRRKTRRQGLQPDYCNGYVAIVT